jgi:GH15 family glucan-1,4-alpha-glucosidase
VERVDGYAPIRDYGVIGDGRTAALVARDGSIDWLCLPDVDSPAVFAAVLDSRRGGSFELCPDEPFEARRRYVEGTNVLETTFVTTSGTVRVTDALTLVGEDIAPLREVVRRVEGLAGKVRLRWRVDPRFGFATKRARLSTRRTYVVADAGGEAIAIRSCDAGEPRIDDGGFAGEFVSAQGSRHLLVLSHAHRQPLVIGGRDDVEQRLDYTLAFWRRWSGRARYDGPWRAQVVRSALLLKLLVHSPSGAIVAAPTSSLPEWIGGTRNWDYRFTWLRDASYTLDALLDLGYLEEAHAFFWWLMHASRLTQPRLQILYRVNGSAHAPERELDHLAGYRGSRPVRVGNGAAEQLQLDVYGFVLDSIWRYARDMGRLDGDTGKEVARIADFVVCTWREPDSGIWEVRGGTRHFTQSKAMCWVALDRACQLADAGYIPNRGDRWRGEAALVRDFVEEHCWDEQRRSYVRASDLPEADASLLTLALLDYCEGRDPRLHSTIDCVQRELREGPLVWRYRGEDGVPGDEGAFLACSFWLANALARAGRGEEAMQLMDDALGVSNDLGLFSEEALADGTFLGNFPQALTHLALVNAAVSIQQRVLER